MPDEQTLGWRFAPHFAVCGNQENQCIVLSFSSGVYCLTSLAQHLAWCWSSFKLTLGSLEGVEFSMWYLICPCAISLGLKSFANVYIDRIVKILPFLKPRTKEFHYSNKHEFHGLWAHLDRGVHAWGHGEDAHCHCLMLLPLADQTEGLVVTLRRLWKMSFQDGNSGSQVGVSAV